MCNVSALGRHLSSTAPNLPELMPKRFPGYIRVGFDDLSLSEKAHLCRLGAEAFPEFTVDQLSIYRCPEGITFLTPLDLTGVSCV